MGKSARINLLDFSEDVYDGFDREIFQGNGALESEIMLVEIESWVQEIQGEIREGDIGWDDVNGIPLELADVQAARSEEAQYMLNRGMFDFRPREESFEKRNPRRPKPERSEVEFEWLCCVECYCSVWILDWDGLV